MKFKNPFPKDTINKYDTEPMHIEFNMESKPFKTELKKAAAQSIINALITIGKQKVKQTDQPSYQHMQWNKYLMMWEDINTMPEITPMDLLQKWAANGDLGV